MKNIIPSILLAIALLFAINVSAQPGGGGPGGGGDPDVPIGGVELLLLAGAALGVRKVYNKKK